jgi:hypothetical protein
MSTFVGNWLQLQTDAGGQQQVGGGGVGGLGLKYRKKNNKIMIRDISGYASMLGLHWCFNKSIFYQNFFKLSVRSERDTAVMSESETVPTHTSVSSQHK